MVQPVSFLSLGLTAATGAGLLLWFQSLQREKLKGTETPLIITIQARVSSKCVSSVAALISLLELIFLSHLPYRRLQ